MSIDTISMVIQGYVRKYADLHASAKALCLQTLFSVPTDTFFGGAYWCVSGGAYRLCILCLQTSFSVPTGAVFGVVFGFLRALLFVACGWCFRCLQAPMLTDVVFGASTFLFDALFLWHPQVCGAESQYSVHGTHGPGTVECIRFDVVAASLRGSNCTLFFGIHKFEGKTLPFLGSIRKSTGLDERFCMVSASLRAKQSYVRVVCARMQAWGATFMDV